MEFFDLFLDFLPSLLPIVLLVLCSGFFSGSETALTALSRAKIHKLKMEGNKRAALTDQLRSDKDSLIGVILLGNNAVNILASALATSFAIHWFGNQGVAYATIGMTIVILIFAEVLPKTFAFRHAEQVALWVAPVFIVIVKIFAPVTMLVNYVVQAILGMGKKKGKMAEVVSSTDALRGAIALHYGENDTISDHKHMLDGVLDLSEIEVGEVMNHRKRMFSCDADQSPSDMIDQILDSGHTRVPLWREKPDNIVGVLHLKSLLAALRSHEGGLDSLNLIEIAYKPWFVPETTKLWEQLNAFRDRRNHFALVVNEYGDLVGLITLEDVIEEIVGQINDEHDIVTEGIKPVGKKGFEINGEVPIRDINRQLEWDLPDEDAATLAGLVLHVSEKIPVAGERFILGDYRFTVLKRSKNQVTLVLVKRKKV